MLSGMGRKVTRAYRYRSHPTGEQTGQLGEPFQFVLPPDRRRPDATTRSWPGAQPRRPSRICGPRMEARVPGRHTLYWTATRRPGEHACPGSVADNHDTCGEQGGMPMRSQRAPSGLVFRLGPPEPGATNGHSEPTPASDRERRGVR